MGCFGGGFVLVLVPEGLGVEDRGSAPGGVVVTIPGVEAHDLPFPSSTPGSPPKGSRMLKQSIALLLGVSVVVGLVSVSSTPAGLDSFVVVAEDNLLVVIFVGECFALSRFNHPGWTSTSTLKFLWILPPSSLLEGLHISSAILTTSDFSDGVSVSSVLVIVAVSPATTSPLFLLFDGLISTLSTKLPLFKFAARIGVCTSVSSLQKFGSTGVGMPFFLAITAYSFLAQHFVRMMKKEEKREKERKARVGGLDYSAK